MNQSEREEGKAAEASARRDDTGKQAVKKALFFYVLFVFEVCCQFYLPLKPCSGASVVLPYSGVHNAHFSSE